MEDVTPVSTACRIAFGFGVGPAVPASVKNLKDYLAWAKANPGAGQLRLARRRLAAALPRRAARQGGRRRPAPRALPRLGARHPGPARRPGAGDELADRRLPALPEGRQAAPARHLGPTRSRFAPDVPTYAEQGFKELVMSEYYEFFLPGKAAPERCASAPPTRSRRRSPRPTWSRRSPGSASKRCHHVGRAGADGEGRKTRSGGRSSSASASRPRTERRPRPRPAFRTPPTPQARTMWSYAAPLAHMRFVIDEVLGCARAVARAAGARRPRRRHRGAGARRGGEVRGRGDRADQRHRRPRGLPLAGRTAASPRRPAFARRTAPTSRAAGRRSPATRPTAAAACRGCSTPRSPRCSPRRTTPGRCTPACCTAPTSA